MSIKKIIYRKFKTLKTVLLPRHQVGLCGVFWNCVQKLTKFGFCEEQYTNIVFKYLERYQPIIDSFNNYVNLKSSNPNSKIIWSYWAQGISKAPPLIRDCWESMQKHGNGCKLVLLDNSNVSDYCEFPGYVWDKHKKGLLSNQQLSNILRYSLVHWHGGLWIDSTFFLTKDIPGFVFEQDYWIEKGPDSVLFTKHITNALGEGTVAAKPGCIVPAYFKTMFLEYWKKETVLIDFHLHNAWFAMGMESVPQIRNLIFSVPFNNPNAGALCQLQNKPFDTNIWESITKDGLGFFKMNWRNPPSGTKDNFFNIVKRQNEIE